MTAHLVRVVGPPGSGKSLLITSLQEALRMQGVRSAAVSRPAPGTTAITISAGGRSTLDRDVPLSYLPTVISWIDPTVEVILAEGYEESGETGAPAVEIRVEGSAPAELPEAERFAVVSAKRSKTAPRLRSEFARSGPGYTGGVAERIVRDLLGREPAAGGSGEGDAETGGDSGEGGLLRRMLGRFRSR